MILKVDTLATWYKELTQWKRPWCWERLRTGGEGDDRGWDGWMASPTQWKWVWVNSWSWWWDREAWHAAVHGVAKSQTWLSNWTEVNEVLTDHVIHIILTSLFTEDFPQKAINAETNKQTKKHQESWKHFRSST